jgi:hypothetical protein
MAPNKRCGHSHRIMSRPRNPPLRCCHEPHYPRAHGHSHAPTEFAALPAVPDLPVCLCRAARDRHLRARATGNGTFLRDVASGDPVERFRLHGGLCVGPARIRARSGRIRSQARTGVRPRHLYDRLRAVTRRAESGDVPPRPLSAGLRYRRHQPAREGDHHRFVLRTGADTCVHVHGDRVGARADCRAGDRCPSANVVWLEVLPGLPARLFACDVGFGLALSRDFAAAGAS